MVNESNLEFMSPWRCEGPCGELMYNKTWDGYPAPGAPVGYSIDTGGGTMMRVCSLCKDMWLIAASNGFMRKEHVKWGAQREQAERLKPGKKYLD